MTDDTASSQIIADKPTVDPFMPPAEPVSAKDRLRAYEDHLFGKDAVRIRGQVERGFGSKHKEMKDAQRRHYDALEKAIVAEQALADAESKLIDAKNAHEAAAKEVADSEADAHAGE